MIEITFGQITVDNMSGSSGIFIGHKNKLKDFQYEKMTDEAVGILFGNENKLSYNKWMHIKETWEDN
jgi:hypothetical protein